MSPATGCRERLHRILDEIAAAQSDLDRQEAEALAVARRDEVERHGSAAEAAAELWERRERLTLARQALANAAACVREALEELRA
ncbi:MAG: hypothetical protein HY720_10590 [Planctomycetes bacterium]|nr:hypothetical protein [Planctomycetota bacterium]